MISPKETSNSDLLCMVPAGGFGTRLSPITLDRAKPSIAISYDNDGRIIRMIDIPLSAIRQAGGIAVVSTFYQPDSLEFVNNYPGVQVVREEAPGSPIDTLIDQIAFLESSTASTVGIIPGDAWLEPDDLQGMRRTLDTSGAVATILGTRVLGRHNLRTIDERAMVIPSGSGTDMVADLGVHLFRKDWLLGRFRDGLVAKRQRDSIDIWQDLYNIDQPTDPIAMHLPDDPPDWVDMGTPANLFRAVQQLNSARADKSNNVLFPHARIHASSSNVLALPGSNSITYKLQHAIVPEGIRMRCQDDALAS